MRKRNRTVWIGAAMMTALVAIGFGHALENTMVAQGGHVQAPRFEVDPY